jgi:hypothetical protein
MEEHSLNSSFREKLIEHLFIGELLKLSWVNKDFSLEVSTPEIDNSGYDLIVESLGVIRHIQLKSAFVGAKTSRQNVNVALSTKQSGCVVWIYFCQNSLKLGPYLFFGNNPGEPLPDLTKLKVARHTKGDAVGYKAERPNIRTINKGRFKHYETITDLYDALFRKG